MIQPYNEFNTKTGKKIREVRLKRKYTRDYLAVQADISSKFLYEIEIGKKGCSAYILYRLAVALGVKVDCLIAYDGTEYPDILETTHDGESEIFRKRGEAYGAEKSSDCGGSRKDERSFEGNCGERERPYCNRNRTKWNRSL